MNQTKHSNSPEDQVCFLCDPPRDLLYFECSYFFALAGLGPLVDGYSVLAVRNHVKSMADLPPQLRGRRDDVVRMLRDRLSRKYGGCLITEHGRMALCTEGHEYDAHCYHAHFLLFPGAGDISGLARGYFSHMESFIELEAAMLYAANSPEYMLVSPAPSTFNIFTGPLNIPRQLARVLVANDVARLDLADWRDQPNRDRAKGIASELRSLVREAK